MFFSVSHLCIESCIGWVGGILGHSEVVSEVFLEGHFDFLKLIHDVESLPESNGNFLIYMIIIGEEKGDELCVAVSTFGLCFFLVHIDTSQLHNVLGDYRSIQDISLFLGGTT